MTTIVTTCDFQIFKLFYENQYNRVFRQNLIVCVDKDDSTEFRKIIDEGTIVFDKNDIKEFYGDKYLEGAWYCAKMMYLNMIFRKNIIKGALYITDDDVLCFNHSLSDIQYSSKIEYDHDIAMIQNRPITDIIVEMYQDWNGISDWLVAHLKDKPFYKAAATNVFFPDHLATKFMEIFTSYYETYHEVIFKNLKYINECNLRTKSSRGVNTTTFYLEVPFFNSVYACFDKSEVKETPMYLFIWSKWKGFIKDNETKEILESYFNYNNKTYPKVQPLVHFSITNKILVMRNVYNYLNNIDEFDTIDYILNNKLIKKPKLSKALF